MLFSLLDIIATLYEKVNLEQIEKQALRDEINYLKGEQGKPTIRPNKIDELDYSSEKERNPNPCKRNKGRGKRNDTVIIHRTEKCYYSREDLPPDAVFKGYHRVIVQNFKVVPDKVQYLVEVFYSPSAGKTYLAERPPGQEGEYGADVRTMILSLKHMGNMSEPNIHSLLTSWGVRISKSSISRIALKDAALFHEEAEDILKAGLISTEYTHIDDTGARVDGKQHHTHILCNPFFTAYVTTPHKDRLTVLRILLMGNELQFCFNDATFELLEIFKVPEKVQGFLKKECKGKTLNEEQLRSIIKDIPSTNRNPDQLHRRILEAAGIAWYHEQKEIPIVHTLISDDAAQFRHIANWHSLCWVHAGRIIKKINPPIPIFKESVDKVLDEFWSYYRTLLEFQIEPKKFDVDELQEQFDKIFSQTTGFSPLDKILESLLKNKEKLLVVLKFPQTPLHNNPAELGARNAVRKRDVSLHTNSQEGTKAVDTALTIVQTAKKLGVNVRDYIHDRITKNEMEKLAITLLKKVGLDLT